MEISYITCFDPIDRFPTVFPTHSEYYGYMFSNFLLSIEKKTQVHDDHDDFVTIFNVLRLYLVFQWQTMERNSTPAGGVPVAVGLGSMQLASAGSNSTVSELTTPSRVVPRRRVADQLTLESTLASLAGATATTSSPAIPPFAGRLPEDEEEAIESLWYADYEDGDSDEEDPEILDTTILDTVKDRIANAEENDCALDTIEQYSDDWKDSKEDLGIATERILPGAPAGWNPPTSPMDWEPSVEKHGQPSFAQVDNPGKWSQFTFRPQFTGTLKKGDIKYSHHSLPTGATPVPLDENGKRCVAGWDFHYQGWSRESDSTASPIPSFRSGATRDNMFPECRKGSLDGELLSRLGLTADRMIEKDGAPDALFFYQLLLPIHHIGDKKVTTVENDPRKPFYTKAAIWSNMYAAGELKILGSGYGHQFQSVEPPELLQWDGSVVMDGVLGGSQGAILRRFDTRPGNSQYHELMAKTFTKSRWLELKRVYKLCNNLTAMKRGTDGYNPAYKYDFLFETLIHNVNAITLDAGLDLCGDETTFGFNGWGEAGTGLLGLIMNKPGITRGGQVVMVVDADRIRPRAYIHRHKLQTKYWNSQGENEVRLIYEELIPLITGGTTNRPRPLFKGEKPHITWDNFFSGDNIMQYAAEQGFGFTSTCRRDRLPKGIPSKYLHKGKTDSSARPKAARFEEPIFAVKLLKQDPADKNRVTGAMQLTSFQSTSSCNFTSVNALNSLSLYCQAKERGRGIHKRRWAIEMNEGRQLYLKTYGGVDRLDHLVQNCNMSYRCWKYWHAAMLHGKSIAVVVAYDLYLECCEGKMRAGQWKVEKAVDFHRFREKLATQMLQYSPKHRKYPGDEQFRVSTRQHKDRRPPSGLSSARSVASSAATNGRTSDSGSTSGGLLIKKKHFQSEESLSRHCGDLTPLYPHVEQCISIRNGGKKTCVVCGEQAYHVCMACIGPDGKKGVAMHRFARKGKPVSCFYHHHNSHFFGLARNDHKLLGIRKRDWTYPTEEVIQSHAKKIRHVLTLEEPLLRVRQLDIANVAATTTSSNRRNNSASSLGNSRHATSGRLTRVDTDGNLVGLL